MFGRDVNHSMHCKERPLNHPHSSLCPVWRAKSDAFHLERKFITFYWSVKSVSYLYLTCSHWLKACACSVDRTSQNDSVILSRENVSQNQFYAVQKWRPNDFVALKLWKARSYISICSVFVIGLIEHQIVKTKSSPLQMTFFELLHTFNKEQEINDFDKAIKWKHCYQLARFN